MTENTLALLIPAYNAASFLPRLLQSAISQTVPFDEIWVYDDCSSDDTSDVAKSFGARIIRGDINRGCSHGKNVLAAQTKCEWLHFHDADDELLPVFVKTARSWMEADTHDVVLFAFEERDDRGAHRDVWRFDHAELATDPLSYAIRRKIVSICGLYRRATFLSAGGYDTDPDVLYNEDVAMHVRLALQGLRFAADPTIAIINHRQIVSMSASHQAKCAAAHYSVMRKVSEHPKGSRYNSEIASRLRVVAAVAAAYLDWRTADRAAILAQRLTGSFQTEGDNWALNVLSVGFTCLAVRLRELAIRLLKPRLRTNYPRLWRRLLLYKNAENLY